MRAIHAPSLLILLLAICPTFGESAAVSGEDARPTYGVPSGGGLEGETEDREETAFVGGVKPYEGDDIHRVTPPPAPIGIAAPDSVRAVSQSSWFALASGLASILGLLIPLYATQVRSIPFSLYRSLTWRKIFLIAGGFGLIVYSGMKLLSVDPRLGRLFDLFSFIFSEGQEPLRYRLGYLETIFWTFSIICGLVIIRRGASYDPVTRARQTLIREHESLEEARKAQVDRLLAGRAIGKLPPLEHRMLRDILDFYRHVQWRYADVVLGAPPPTFPLFRDERHTSANEDEA